MIQNSDQVSSTFSCPLTELNADPQGLKEWRGEQIVRMGSFHSETAPQSPLRHTKPIPHLVDGLTKHVLCSCWAGDL